MQWEGAAIGKVAQLYQGKGQVVNLVATMSVDYGKKSEAFEESVFLDGKFVGNYTYLTTAVSTYNCIYKCDKSTYTYICVQLDLPIIY